MLVEEIGRMHEVLKICHGLQPNLCFTRAVVKSAIRQLVQIHGSKYRLKPAEVPDYIESTTCRLLNLLRSVSQGVAKSPRPSWVQQLPWVIQDEGASSKRQKVASKGETSEWIIKWDS